MVSFFCAHFEVSPKAADFILNAFCCLDSCCGFVNTKSVIVGFEERSSIFSKSLLNCKIRIAVTLMASESYYHPIRECGILVILLLFPVGREYNGEGQGLMQFISCNSVTASPLSFLGSLFLNAGTATSIRTPPNIPKK